MVLKLLTMGFEELIVKYTLKIQQGVSYHYKKTCPKCLSNIIVYIQTTYM